jgi:drug/metabolite transporter (DMT)-like permease
MGFLYLLIAVIGASTGTTIDKLNFRRNRIAARQLILLIFFAMSASLLAFVLLTHQPFPHFVLASLALVVIIALVSFGSNAFDYLSLKADDLSLREPLNDFEPIVAGLIGYALFPSERKPGFLLAFGLGAIIVYYGTHRRKLRRLQKRGMTYLLLGICLEALLPSTYLVSLHYLSPVYIALFRVMSVLVLSSIFLPVRHITRLSSKKLGYAMVSGSIYALATVAGLFAIKDLGVVLTMLLSLLGPFLRYSAGYFVFKENVRKGEVTSSALLVLVVLIPIIR